MRLQWRRATETVAEEWEEIRVWGRGGRDVHGRREVRLQLFNCNFTKRSKYVQESQLSPLKILIL